MIMAIQRNLLKVCEDLLKMKIKIRIKKTSNRCSFDWMRLLSKDILRFMVKNIPIGKITGPERLVRHIYVSLLTPEEYEKAVIEFPRFYSHEKILDSVFLDDLWWHNKEVARLVVKNMPINQNSLEAYLTTVAGHGSLEEFEECMSLIDKCESANKLKSFLHTYLYMHDEKLLIALKYMYAKGFIPDLASVRSSSCMYDGLSHRSIKFLIEKGNAPDSRDIERIFGPEHLLDQERVIDLYDYDVLNRGIIYMDHDRFRGCFWYCAIEGYVDSLTLILRKGVEIPRRFIELYYKPDTILDTVPTEEYNFIPKVLFCFATRIAMLLTKEEVEQIRFPFLKKKIVKFRNNFKKRLMLFFYTKIIPNSCRPPINPETVKNITSRTDMINFLNTGGRLFALDNWDYLTGGLYGPNPFRTGIQSLQ